MLNVVIDRCVFLGFLFLFNTILFCIEFNYFFRRSLCVLDIFFIYIVSKTTQGAILSGDVTTHTKLTPKYSHVNFNLKPELRNWHCILWPAHIG